MKAVNSYVLKQIATWLTMGLLVAIFIPNTALAFNTLVAENIALQATSWPPMPKLKKLIPKNVSVTPLDEKNQKLADRMKAALDTFKPVDSYRMEVKVSELAAAKANMEETSSIVSTAKTCVKRMDHKARNHVKIKVLREKLKKVQDYYSAANSNFQTVKKAEEEKAKAQKDAERLARRKYTEASRRFFQVYKGIHRLTHWANFKTPESTKNFKGSIGIYSESHITKAQDMAKQARTACSTPSYVAPDKETYQLADALVADKYCTKDDNDCSKIADICEMAKLENLNPALTNAYIRTLNESVAVQVKRVHERIEKVRKGAGLMDGRDFMNTMRYLNGGKWAANANIAVFTNEIKRVEGYFKLLNAQMPEGGPYTTRNAANKLLGEEVLKQIKSWGRWPKDGKFKEAHATKAVKKELDKLVKTIKIGMREDSWNIKKNGLGITISRYKYGYLISKVKGNKYCQLTGFKYVEKYIGAAKFQKKGGVGYDRVIKPVTCK